MNTPSIKAIVFDLDNTLIDRQAAAYALYRLMVKDCFPSHDEGDFEFEAIVQDLMTWDEFGSITKKHPLSMMCHKYNLDTAWIDRLNQRWSDELPSHTVVYPKVFEVLTALSSKYRLGIITNGNSKNQWEKLEKSGLLPHFEQVIVSGDKNIHKPDVTIFKDMADRMQLETHECVFVGDTFSTDIIGAIQAGMQPIWICSDKKRACAPFVKRIVEIHDILELF